MGHAKPLRVIGQSLEVSRVETFELEKDAQDYIVRSDSLSKTGEWILRHALNENDFSPPSGRQRTANLRFTPADISRLDAQGQRHRQNQASSNTQGSNRPSQLLRALGDHLDRIEANDFRISWTLGFVSVDYRGPDGESDSRAFTAEQLQRLGTNSRFRRSSLNARYGFSASRIIHMSGRADTPDTPDSSLPDPNVAETSFRRGLKTPKK